VLEKWRNLNLSRKSHVYEHYFSTHPKSKPKLGVIHAFMRGRHFEFISGSGVFSKDRIDLGTRLLVESMILPDEGYVLDLGCGYGAIGITAAMLKACLNVFMVDVNQRAVWLARQNIEKNGLSNAEVRRGEFYEPVEGLCFDSVLCNPPVSAGMDTVKRIITEAPKHLLKGGFLQLVVRSKICGPRLISYFEEAFENSKVLARESGYRVLFSEKC
jgi:16S rRNA (guanine1207-N2)-methyltransferase